MGEGWCTESVPECRLPQSGMVDIQLSAELGAKSGEQGSGKS